MKEQIIQLIRTYRDKVEELKSERVNLFNMEQVHPLQIHEYERQTQLNISIEIYKQVINDLVKLL